MNVADNSFWPTYDDMRPALSALEERLVKTMGEAPDAKSQLLRDPRSQAVFRMVVYGGRSLRFCMASLTMYPDGATVRSVAYRQENMPRNYADFAAAAQHLNDDDLGKSTLVWRRDFGVRERDHFAFEMNRAGLMGLDSCKLSQRVPIPPELTLTCSRLTSDGSPHQFLPVRFFCAMRWRDEATEHSFQAYGPEETADIRYERLMYVFRTCEPLSVVFERMERGYWQFESSLSDTSPVPAASENVPKGRQRVAVPLWLAIAVAAPCLLLGLILGRRWAARRRAG